MAARWSLLVLLIPMLAQAAPPTLSDIRPRGLERGKPVTLLLSGANLTPQSVLKLPFPAKQEPVADPKPNPAAVKIVITAAANVPVGIYPVRAVTENGLSATFLLAVDALPSIKEVEDNNTPEKAQRIPLPVVIDGDCARRRRRLFPFHGQERDNASSSRPRQHASARALCRNCD